MKYEVCVCDNIYTMEADTTNEAKSIACDLHYDKTGSFVSDSNESVFIIRADEKLIKERE